MKIVILPLVLLAGGLSITNVASAIRSAPKDMRPGNTVIGLKKNMRELDNKEIVRELSGRYIVPAGDEISDAFSEFFYKNGSWKGVRDQRVAKQYSGTWIVQGNKLCVGIEAKSICRSIFKDVGTGRLYTTDFLSSISKNKLLGVKSFIIK